MIKAVIFDLDGLLVDTEIISYQIYKELLNEYGYTFTKEEYARNYSGKTGIKNMAGLIEAYQLPWTLEEGMAKEEPIESRFLARGVALKRGAKELLSFLKEKNYKTVVASSSTEGRALDMLREHGIVGCFDEFVFARDVERGKPNPDIFLKACEKMGERPENCLVLEDGEAGIQAGDAAGMSVVCIPDMKRPDQDFLDKTAAVLDSLDEVISYLGKSVKRSPE